MRNRLGGSVLAPCGLTLKGHTRNGLILSSLVASSFNLAMVNSEGEPFGLPFATRGCDDFASSIFCCYFSLVFKRLRRSYPKRTHDQRAKSVCRPVGSKFCRHARRTYIVGKIRRRHERLQVGFDWNRRGRGCARGWGACRRSATATRLYGHVDGKHNRQASRIQRLDNNSVELGGRVLRRLIEVRRILVI